MKMEEIVRSNSNNGYGLPPADTGVWLLNWIADASTFLVHLERRFDPFFRRAFDFLFRQLAHSSVFLVPRFRSSAYARFRCLWKSIFTP